MSTKWQRFEVKVPKDLSASEREFIGQEILDYIRERAEKGQGIGGKPFPSYSEEYVKSLEFKIAGKSKSKIDLTLSGDMLGAMDLLDHKPGKLVIGFEKGSAENAKADGNIRGTYGQDKPNPSKARNFLGLSRKELESILGRLSSDERKEEAAVSRAASRIVDGDEGDNGEA